MAHWTLVVACLVAAVVPGCSGVEAGRVLKDGKLDRKLLWSSTTSALSADAHGISRVLLAPGAEPKDPNEPTGVDRDMSADTHFARIAKFSKKAGGDEEAEGDEGGRRHLMQNVGRVLLAPGAEPKDPNEPTGVDRDMSADTHFARIAKFSKKAGGDVEAEGDEGGRRHLMQNGGRVLLAPGAEPKDPNEPTGVDRDMSADTHFARIAKFSKKAGGDEEAEGDEGGRRHLMQNGGRVLLAPGAEPKDPNEPTGVDRDMSADTHFARIAKFSKKAGGDEEAEGDEGGRKHLMQNVGRVLLAPGAEPKDPNEPTGVDRDMSADTHFARIAKFSKKAGGDEEAEGDEGGRRHLMQN